jgi:hypothetical protein
MGAHAGHNTGILAGAVARLERKLAGLAGWSPRGMLLYILPLPLIPALCVSLVRGDFTQVVGQLGALGGCWTAAAIARRGLRAEAVYHHRRIARMPVPRKSAAALLLGASVFVGAWLAVGHEWPLAALLGAGSTTGFVLAYGPDRDEVLRTLEEAESRIQRIEADSRRIPAGELSQRLERIAASARSVVDLLEEDPRDLRRARRFLNTYLSGAQQVTERYVHARPRRATPEIDDRFRSVLGTIEGVFDEQRRHLLEDEVLDLDVQIEVLSRQLEREAVA